MFKEIKGKKYRLNIGIAVMNLENKFWVGKRSFNLVPDKSSWQMPQGGQDENESPKETAIRELYEETGIKSVKILKITDWMKYDYPPEVKEKRNHDGQIQKWVLVLFTGDDSEINLNIDKEFIEYKWETYQNIIKEIISFKKPIYEKLFNEFKDYIN